MRKDGGNGKSKVGLHKFRNCKHGRYTEVFPEDSRREHERRKMMLEFAPDTYMLDYQYEVASAITRNG